MELWWNALNLELQVFYGIGILALLVLLLQFAMLLFGGLDHDPDFSADSVDHDSGLGLFSFRGITAFFVGFGWTGVIALKADLPLAVAILLALLVGSALMVAIYFLMRAMMRLQSSGTLNYANAVGEVATVYVTVPPEGKSGGQIEVMVQGRLITTEAIHNGPDRLSQGTKVKVVELIGRSTLLVEPLKR